jgi:uncharacterized membrane protein YuzA (DUF378 family)
MQPACFYALGAVTIGIYIYIHTCPKRIITENESWARNIWQIIGIAASMCLSVQKVHVKSVSSAMGDDVHTHI